MLTPLLVLSLLAVAASPQAGQAPPTPRDGPAKPDLDPIVVRGCLDGKRFRIVEHDVGELSGVRYLTLKMPRAMKDLLADHRHAYLELTGQLELPPGDRIETRKRYAVGSKTTVTVGAKAEQIKDVHTSAEPDVSTLQVETFTPIDGDQCRPR